MMTEREVQEMEAALRLVCPECAGEFEDERQIVDPPKSNTPPPDFW